MRQTNIFYKTVSLMVITLLLSINVCNSQQSLSQIQIDKIDSLATGLPDSTIINFCLIGDNSIFGQAQVFDDTVLISTEPHSPLAFEIGSISKVFTSTLLAMAVTEGKINLEDNIESVLGFELHCEEDISFKQLSNHTSGLPALPTNIFEIMGKHQDNPYKYYTPALLETYLQNDVKLMTPPGEQYSYSNLAVGLLGHLLSKVYDTTYEQLLQEKIFSPLGMKNSTIDREKLKIDLVSGRQASGQKTSNWDFDALAGAGAIKSTVQDLSLFAIHQFDSENKVNNLTQKITHTNNSLSMALGWHIVKDDEDRELLFHNGATGGYSSSMLIDKATNKAVILLSNVSAFHFERGRIDKLCSQLQKTLTQE